MEHFWRGSKKNIRVTGYKEDEGKIVFSEHDRGTALMNPQKL